MKYSLIQVVNGNYSITSETTDLNAAKVQFHTLCAAFWNDSDVETACVMIVDENLDRVDDYKEFISHVEPEPSEV